MDVIQDRLYRDGGGRRLDTSRLYIRNSMSQAEEQTKISIEILKVLLDEHKPSIVLTFGVSAYMTALFASGESPQKIFQTTKLLGEQFRNRIENYHHDKVNIIPLLHVSIARRHFLEAHEYFVDSHGSVPSNYFEYVGVELADLLLARFSASPIWVG